MLKNEQKNYKTCEKRKNINNVRRHANTISFFKIIFRIVKNNVQLRNKPLMYISILYFHIFNTMYNSNSLTIKK